jgi:hypothetical protein
LVLDRHAVAVVSEPIDLVKHREDGFDGSMTGEQRADLERIAFGRTHTREDEDAAAAARKELAEADRAAEVAAARRADVAAANAAGQEVVGLQQSGPASWSLAPTLPDDELLAPPPPEAPRKAVRRIHTAWLVPIIAGSLAAGYFGATIAVAGAVQGPATPTPSPSDTPSTVQLLPTPEPPAEVTLPVRGSGNLKEADAWFEAPQREVDGFAQPELLKNMEIDPSAVRFVQTDAAGYSAWVAKNHNGDLCVLGTDASGGAFASCVPRDDFERSGANISSGGHAITWNGSAVTVTNPRSQTTP